MSASTITTRVIAFPKTGIAYNICLYAAAESAGISVIEGIWSGRWLLANVRRGDVLHIHWPSFLYFDQQSHRRTWVGLLRFVLLVRSLILRGARLVWTAHNLYPHDVGRASLAHRIARRFMAHYSECIFVHGPTAGAILAREFGIPQAKLRIIKHGHWIGYHQHTLSAVEARRHLDIDLERFVYAFVGACRPYKNLALLIETFAKLDDNSVLVIAGHFQSSTYRAHIEALLQRLPADRWRFRPELIPDDEIQRYVLAGNVLVIPYTEILTSGSAMLGMSFGRPVIAPNAGGLRDMVNSQCGLLYDAGAADPLFNALRNIRSMQFSESVIIECARTCDWLDAAKALVQIGP